MDGSQGRPEGQKNVLGGALQSCSHDPMTGFFRDGCCHTCLAAPVAENPGHWIVRTALQRAAKDILLPFWATL